MDRSGCPAGRATDSILVLPKSLCGAPIDIYAAWLGACVVIKFITAFGISYDWHARYIRRTAKRGVNMNPNNNTTVYRRLPLVPAMQWIQAIFLLVLCAATSTGVCSSDTGCSLALYAILQMNSGFYNILLIKQFIKLGRNMIPLARSKVKAAVASSNSSNGEPRPTDSNDRDKIANSNSDTVATEDGFLRAVIVIRFFAEITHFLIAVPVQLLRPRSEYEAYLSAFFGLSSFCTFLGLVAYLAQLERLIRATKTGCIKPYKTDVLRALDKMRRTEVGYSVIHISISILYIVLATRVLAPEWFIIGIVVSFETASTTITFFWFVVQKYLKIRRASRSARARGRVGETTMQGTGTMTMAVDGSIYEVETTTSAKQSGGFAALLPGSSERMGSRTNTATPVGVRDDE